MNIFVDTGAWIALADENDIKHNAAKKIYDLLKKKNVSLIITDYIFDETTTWLHYKVGHVIACDWGNKILDSHMVNMILWHRITKAFNILWCERSENFSYF
ncbi:nucleic acid-binding protein, contains PIN domain protein [Candidatus Magnetomorum sp. HK-1]|nr:nucleic acid-binding protein, contains PIN domain protein [Candidatus Magnetomorum sp. HK-1]